MRNPRLPVVGELVSKVIFARFARTLSLLFVSGFPMVRSLQSCEKIVGNAAVAADLAAARAGVQRGSGISEPLRREAKVFPPMLVEMIRVGEETGELDAMLDQAAGFYELEVEQSVKTLTSIIEPLILVLLGGVIFLTCSVFVSCSTWPTSSSGARVARSCGCGDPSAVTVVALRQGRRARCWRASRRWCSCRRRDARAWRIPSPGAAVKEALRSQADRANVSFHRQRAHHRGSSMPPMPEDELRQAIQWSSSSSSLPVESRGNPLRLPGAPERKRPARASGGVRLGSWFTTTLVPRGPSAFTPEIWTPLRLAAGAFRVRAGWATCTWGRSSSTCWQWTASTSSAGRSRWAGRS